ncbi:Uncharacterized protein SCF082_LOCUS20283 [Durusdinium trenchii]|uniref:Uncharacterized protein n=1 Tax=Durusdinium trenchii TaxID=1381693 RepID=A0ABP0L1K4_9DINO
MGLAIQPSYSVGSIQWGLRPAANATNYTLFTDWDGKGSPEAKAFNDFCAASGHDDRKFLDFIASSSQQEDSQVPPCVRLSLETLHGSVGVDLFHVKVPGAPGEEMHLLALKEDPESRSHPDASPTAPVARNSRSSAGGFTSSAGAASSASSWNEVVDAVEALEEVTLLLNNGHRAQSIEEAHLRFASAGPRARGARGPRGAEGTRKGHEMEMPSLKRLTRATDWPNLLKILQGYVDHLRSGEEGQLSMGPLFLKLPGNRSYVRANHAVLSSPDTPRLHQFPPERPVRLWLHLSNLDQQHVTRAHEPSLQEILEQ